MTIRSLKQILALASVLFDIWANSFTHNRQTFPIGVSGYLIHLVVSKEAGGKQYPMG